MNFIKRKWKDIALIFILILSMFLSFYGVWKQGYANSYYTAAVKSMLMNWHNFFYASFDPAGFVTVDKPALGLWIQALFAWIFGVHGWSVILPEALSTVISTAIVYHIVKRSFGKNAGLISALIFSTTPILIAVSRTNNLDASLIMVLLLAVWAAIVAAERGSLKHLLISMALVGIGFNIKMLQAYMIIIGLFMLYFFTANISLRKRIIHTIVSAAVLISVSLSWAVIVDLTPADKRPYIGSSSTNSVLELALGYNGIQRLLGHSVSKSAANNMPMQPNMGTPPDMNQTYFQGENKGMPPDMNQNGNASFDDNGIPFNQSNNGTKDSADSNSQATQRIDKNMQRIGGNGGVGGVGENGNKGILRLFNEKLAGQISWLIPSALFGVLILAINIKKKDKNNLRHLILWSGIMFPMIVFFSIAGFYHRYYLSMLAPSIAVLSGIGIIKMWEEYREKSWKSYLLPNAIAINALIQAIILSKYSWGNILIPLVLGIGLISSILLIMVKNKNIKYAKIFLISGLLALLISPFAWSLTPMIYGDQSVMPNAGPQTQMKDLGRMNNIGINNKNPMPSNFENNSNSSLVKFLKSKRNGEKYLVAVPSSHTADSIILEYGESVMTYGGFSGSDPILTVEKLKSMLEKGEIRYFAIGGMGGNQTEIINWVKQNGKQVSQSDWSNTDGNNIGDPFRGGENITLYDLMPDKN
ncbi:Dolichyl-phosphate-mannose-protein mannosyltransferase [Caloramator quimbayensis]|uniref:Dolichyl-phosphate-mannose-protein mannosyltransferase n=1 Tax=Caloramator quimbayensis TaxID=1147123 RepID=A0A1T4Y022_9CLOT|nr:glycosyltransferase family 39 protein [Caloramator quimbayensis]SKA95174.1 Dolichyl-phosphate-mannose-protein mannosyltransferase [Caloramator quimbayensis]